MDGLEGEMSGLSSAEKQRSGSAGRAARVEVVVIGGHTSFPTAGNDSIEGRLAMRATATGRAGQGRTRRQAHQDVLDKGDARDGAL